jgi:2-amino-4-hydroxy-6-hydroxymethyldihydropteridine diphosphokinase
VSSRVGAAFRSPWWRDAAAGNSLRPVEAVVGLGANLGDRRESLGLALGAIAEFSSLQRVSSLYETAPIGPEQPDFLNAAALVSTDLAPQPFLDELLRVERLLGRVRRERWGPRVVDLDILWADGLIVDTPTLAVPHPGLTARAFALLPLLEVAPGAIDPRSGDPLADLKPKLKEQRICPVEGCQWAAGYSQNTRGSRS